MESAIKKFCFFIVVLQLLGSAKVYSKVVTIPFVQLPTGQVLVQAKLNACEKAEYFILETTGGNYLRSDMNYRLVDLGIDTTKLFVDIESVQITDFIITDKTKFTITNRIENRNGNALSPLVIGSIGPKIFKGKVVQLNYLKKTIKVADKIDELEQFDKGVKANFSNSFLNSVPKVTLRNNIGHECDVAIEISAPVGFVVDQENFVNAKPCNINLFGEKGTEVLKGSAEVLYINDDITIYNPEVYISDKIQISIGNKFLEHFVSTFDFNNKFLYLEYLNEKGKALITAPGKERNNK